MVPREGVPPPGTPRRKGHARSVECIKTFMAVLRKLKYGTTIAEMQRDLGLGRRQIHRWLDIVEEVFGLDRSPGSRPQAKWIYGVNRDKIRERF